MQTRNQTGIWRIVDANVNRVKEGLRVCEEAARFVLDNRSFTRALKDARHAIEGLAASLPAREVLLDARQSSSDVGTASAKSELRRRNTLDIFYANIQRVKEGLRVLEEFTKLTDTTLSAGFKKIRYSIYAIEKRFARAIASLSHHRS
jgi:thiamine-phosphate pyrophosphorylase